jgi:membrane-bound serine protease (ClpP class)
MLYDVPEKAFDPASAKAFLVPLKLIIPATLTLGLFVLGVMYAVVRVLRRKVLTAQEGMIGQIGTLQNPLEAGQPGQVFLHGELWRAVSDTTLDVGQKVEVIGLEGLTVHVKSAG